MFKVNHPEIEIINKQISFKKRGERKASRKRSKGSWLAALCISQEAISFMHGVQYPEGVYLAIVHMESLVCNEGG